MNPVPNTGFPPGIVAICSQDVVRCVPFVWALLQLDVPQDTHWAWQVSAYIHENRNMCVKNMLDDPKYKWIFFLDDDNTFERNILLKLLAHDKPIVGSFYVKKGYPYIPHLYHFAEGCTEPPYENFKLMDIPENTLFEVDALATSGLLIRREVLEHPEMRDHPFEFLRHMGEDMAFCYKSQKLGYKVYVDTSQIMMHWGTSSVRPGRSEDGTESVVLLRAGLGVDLEIP